MWDLLGPGLEPMSPALAGRFLTIAPPGKSSLSLLSGEKPCSPPPVSFFPVCLLYIHTTTTVHTHSTSDTRCVDFFPHPNNSVTLAGCSTV